MNRGAVKVKMRDWERSGSVRTWRERVWRSSREGCHAARGVWVWGRVERSWAYSE